MFSFNKKTSVSVKHGFSCVVNAKGRIIRILSDPQQAKAYSQGRNGE